MGKVRAIPGVQAVATTNRAPFEVVSANTSPARRGRYSRTEPPVQMLTTVVSPSYFDTLRIPILRGRTFGAEETPTGPRAHHQRIAGEARVRRSRSAQPEVRVVVRWYQLDRGTHDRRRGQGHARAGRRPDGPADRLRLGDAEFARRIGADSDRGPQLDRRPGDGPLHPRTGSETSGHRRRLALEPRLQARRAVAAQCRALRRLRDPGPGHCGNRRRRRARVLDQERTREFGIGWRSAPTARVGACRRRACRRRRFGTRRRQRALSRFLEGFCSKSRRRTPRRHGDCARPRRPGCRLGACAAGGARSSRASRFGQHKRERRSPSRAGTFVPPYGALVMPRTLHHTLSRLRSPRARRDPWSPASHKRRRRRRRSQRATPS